MQIEQDVWRPQQGWEQQEAGGLTADLVLAFAAPAILERPEVHNLVADRYPGARVVSCSTAGEICGARVLDNTLTATAIRFDFTRVGAASVDLDGAGSSLVAARELGEALLAPDLAHVLVFSDGLHVNGSELAAGLAAALPEHVAVTGGLSGDGDRFARTLLGLDGPAAEKVIVAVGFYGRALRVGYGSLGGWDPFGPDRLITRSEGNVLFELDGRPALDLYRRYLGEYAPELPASALLFPLLVHTGSGGGVVRTILGIDDAAGSMTFAGDVPEGTYGRLMKANFDRLVDGATGAAVQARALTEPDSTPELAVLISCVGRKLVLRQRVEEEVEGVRDVLGPLTVLTGFYSYGEISPLVPSARCELHNQTMTVTTFAER